MVPAQRQKSVTGGLGLYDFLLYLPNCQYRVSGARRVYVVNVRRCYSPSVLLLGHRYVVFLSYMSPIVPYTYYYCC